MTGVALPIGRTAAIQNDLMTLIVQAFGKTLKKVDTLPGAWTENTVKTVVMTAPAVYVAWLGSRRDRRPNVVMSSWALFTSASTLSANRRDAIGAHDINDRLVGLLDGCRLPSACAGAEFTQAANLYTDTSARTGVVVCGLYFDIPHVMPNHVTEGDIGEFETYFHQWPVADGAPVQESFNTGLYTNG